MQGPASGTKEWAAHSVNCILGCGHGCRYCYARAMAVRYGRCTADDWTTERIRWSQVRRRRWPRYSGRVMFPTTHDIRPENADANLTVIDGLLSSGNDLLIVSKPHLQVIETICSRFALFAPQVMFRFTVGTLDEDLAGFWEPNAPAPAERLAALEHAHRCGIATSVSAEPLLDVHHVTDLVEAVAPFTTHSVWIGKMNEARARTDGQVDPDDPHLAAIEAGQTDEAVRAVAAAVGDHPLVRFKDSYKRTLGLERPVVAGLDV